MFLHAEIFQRGVVSSIIFAATELAILRHIFLENF